MGVEKGGFGSPIVEEGIPQISNMLFQRALTSEHVAKFGRIPFSELIE